MTIRSTLRDTAFRSHYVSSRGTLVKADDDKKMQEVTITARFGEQFKSVEHWHPYGFSTVPLPPKEGEDGQAETLIMYMGSNRSHPVVASIADRRHRPKNMQAGEVQLHDDQKQKFHHQRDASVHESPKKTITRLTDSNGTEVATITQEATKTTIKRDKSTTVIEGSKITHDVDGTPVVIRKNRIDLGQENAPNAVMTTAGASSKVFSIV
jgi:phage gp45-like